MPYSDTIQVKYTTEPSEHILKLYSKTNNINFAKSTVFSVISWNGEEKGVVGLSQVSGSLWNCHIVSEYPLLGKRLQRACFLIMEQAKASNLITQVITCPINKMAKRFAYNCGFRVINLHPLIMTRRL